MHDKAARRLLIQLHRSRRHREFSKFLPDEAPDEFQRPL